MRIITARDYDAAARAIRRVEPGPRRSTLDTHNLIRLATLAASSHNSQPWRFRIARDRITILPDYARRCRVVDPQDSHLFKSLGCAAENLALAAAAQGFDTDVSYNPTVDGVVIELERSAWARPSELATAITHRQCVRRPYDGRPLGRAELAKLTGIGRGSRAETMILVSDAAKASVIELVTQGNSLQLTDRAHRRELVSWIRFNNRQALRRGDGLSSRANRRPPLPAWLGWALAKPLLDPEAQSARDAKQIRSSAGLAVFIAADDDKAAWVDVGRAYQRFALQATALDIRTALLNQPIEARPLLPQFEDWLQLKGERAMLMARFGHGPKAPFSLRRPVEDVIVQDDRGSQRG